MVKLKVNFTADRLIFHGSVSGVKYEYLPVRHNGEIEVEEADVEELKKIIRKEGCRCNNKDGSVDVQYVEYHLFEDLSN